MKYAVVTGSTKGIGRAIGERFLSEGYNVIFNYSSDDKSAQELCESLQAYTGRFHIIKQNLSSFEDVQEFSAKCKQLTNSISALVLNAGTTDKTPWEDITWQQWNNVMNVNLNAPAFLAQQLGEFVEDKGNIVFIGANMGQHPHAMSIPYGVSKAGLHFLAQSLVKEYSHRLIRINAIAPGFVDTPWQEGKDAQHKKRITDKIAMDRFASPQEVADAVWFVTQNGYMSGAVVDINGGYLYK